LCDRVASLVDGGHRGVVERLGASDGDLAGGHVDRDVADTRQLPQLTLDRAGARMVAQAQASRYASKAYAKFW
jgi:hypothetical protein